MVTPTSSLEDRSVSGSIRRLLILHLDLPHLCNNGLDLDEGASETELSESILYYRTIGSLEGNNSDNENSSLRQSVQFAGFCSAMYKIPEALEEQETEDRTKEVHLDNCSLVFVPLEEPRVLAVAQIARRTTVSYGGTPAAVGAALQRSHLLFRLLRGGGIIHRLGNYEGMRRLYELRKQKRKLHDKLQRTGLEQGEAEIRVAVEIELQDLILKLPITSMREDLRIHYDTLLSDLTLVTAENCGACRSIVECVPAPIPLVSGSHAFVSAPTKLKAYHFASLSLRLQDFLSTVKTDSSNPAIFGISTFVEGKFVSTEVTEQTGSGISNKTAYLLFWYMSSVRSKMAPTGVAASPPPNRAFSPLAVSFGADLVEESTTTQVPCRYLSPPPLSLLSASDEAQDFEGPITGTRVWAPRVSLPGEDSAIVDARVCLYEADHLSFLVFIHHCPPSAGETDTALSQSLRSFDELVTTAPDIEPIFDMTGSDASRWKEPGQDIVLINRSIPSVTLFLNPKQDSHRDGATPMPKSRLRFFTSKLYSDRAKPDQTAPNTRLALDLDCRYLLAFSLSLDLLLAFDDALVELSKPNVSREEPAQLCSLLHQRWIYAYSDGTHELYAFFDPKLYVTVADVQSAADRIRRQLIDCLPEEEQPRNG